jgi:hypothetical protein
MRTSASWKKGASGLAMVIVAYARLAAAEDGGGVDDARSAGEGVTVSDGGAPLGAQSQRAVDEGNAALADHPPRRGDARAAFERATVAADDRVAVGEAYFRMGVLDEEDGAFARALADQRECMAKAPGTNWARSARLRVGWIAARSEGDFLPLARLQRVRRDPGLADEPAALDALAVEAEAFPPGRVRAEARVFVAEAWLTRADKHEDAMAELAKVARDPSSDSIDAALAHRRILDAFLADGRLDEAASEVSRSHFDPKVVAEVDRLVRRRALRRVATAELLAAVAAAVVVVARLGRRGRRERSMRALLRGSSRLALAGVVSLGAVSVVALAFVVLDAVCSKEVGVFGL